MKIVLSSDWHLRSDWWPRRLDSGVDVQREILGWMAGLGDIHVVAGDVFHRWSAPSSFINRVIDWVSKFGKIYAVYGNHDLQANTMKTETSSALHTLELAGVVKTPKEPVQIGDYIFVFEHYGETAMEPAANGEKIVAVVHWPVFEKTVPFWSGDGLTAVEMLEQYPWADIVVCGDIHTPFIVQDGRRVLVNCGGLFRANPDDSEKYVWVLETETGEIERVAVPDKPEFVAVESHSKKPDDGVSGLVSAMCDFELETFDFEKLLVSEIRARGRGDLVPLLNEFMGVEK